MKRSVLAIGRWMPIHLGHKQFLVNLAKEYDLLVFRDFCRSTRLRNEDIFEEIQETDNWSYCDNGQEYI